MCSVVVWCICSPGPSCWALTPDELVAWQAAINELLEHNPRYRYGAHITERPEDPKDCSGSLFWAARKAGFPVKRTTAARMMWGDDGWSGYPVVYVDGGAGDLIGFLMQPRSRDVDHIGALIVHIAIDGDGTGETTMAHASVARGFSRATMTNMANDYWYRRLSHVWRLEFNR